MTKKKINVPALCRGYVQQQKAIRGLVFICLITNVLLMVGWGINVAVLAHKYKNNPKIETKVIEILPENTEVREIQFEEIKLPPLPEISIKP